VCHIYPYRLLKHRKAYTTRKLWDFLRVYWSKDQIKIWKNELSSELNGNGTETSKNLICLSLEAHILWNVGQFALQPNTLSADKKTLTMTFYWQAKLEGDANGHVNLLTQPKSTRGLDRPTEMRTFLYRISDNTPIMLKPGDTFTLTTDDPVNRPLPSFELLQLKFFLQRVCGMGGSVDHTGLTWQSDDEDTYEWQGD
jgi:hypothetical protein